MKVVVSAGGRFHAIHLASQLAQRGHLKRLFTFSFSNNDHTLIPPKNVTQFWLCRFLDQIFQRCRLGRMIDKTKFNFYKDTLFDWCVGRQLSSVAWIPASAGMTEEFDLFVVWANYGLRSIPQAKKRGALVIVESGSAHIKEQAELLTSEYQKYGLCQNPVNPNTIARMTQEYALADYIMVPSTFVYNSFLKHGIPAEKLLTVPCGMNLEAFLSAPRRSYPFDFSRQGLAPLRANGVSSESPFVVSEALAESNPYEHTSTKFRVIFVGLLCLRKGVHYLIDAWNSLDLPEKESELILVGPMQADLAHALKGKKLKKNITFYGSTSQTMLIDLYTQSSVFVLPSIEDGFGMVMGEAMACGLPVICSTHTAAHDLVTHDKTGFVIPAGDAQALADTLRWCYDHPDKCREMGQMGRERIKSGTHTNYGDTIIALYQDILNRKKKYDTKDSFNPSHRSSKR